MDKKLDCIEELLENFSANKISKKDLMKKLKRYVKNIPESARYGYWRANLPKKYLDGVFTGKFKLRDLTHLHMHGTGKNRQINNEWYLIVLSLEDVLTGEKFYAIISLNPISAESFVWAMTDAYVNNAEVTLTLEAKERMDSKQKKYRQIEITEWSI